VILTLLDLSDPPAPPLYIRLSYYLFIMIPNTIIIVYPPIFKLMGS
jgi:hypothetical protein